MKCWTHLKIQALQMEDDRAKSVINLVQVQELLHTRFCDPWIRHPSSRVRQALSSGCILSHANMSGSRVVGRARCLPRRGGVGPEVVEDEGGAGRGVAVEPSPGGEAAGEDLVVLGH